VCAPNAEKMLVTKPVFRTLKIEYQSARRDSKSSGVSA
jgi:hypothetical protein